MWLNELFVSSLVMFILAIIAATLISTIFTKIDKTIDNYNDSNYYDQVIILHTFMQLFIITIAYLAIYNMMEFIFPKKHKYHITKFPFQIILIVLLIELNPSIKYNVKKLAKIVN